MLINENQGVYSIGTMAQLTGQHPETIRVWERNGLVQPERVNNQRRFSNNDLKRLQFIKYFLEEKGLNLAGVRQLTKMYLCWFRNDCTGGHPKDGSVLVNPEKPCWKEPGNHCYIDVSSLNK